MRDAAICFDYLNFERKKKTGSKSIQSSSIRVLTPRTTRVWQILFLELSLKQKIFI